jgi:hypothetical protein
VHGESPVAQAVPKVTHRGEPDSESLLVLPEAPAVAVVLGHDDDIPLGIDVIKQGRRSI